MHQNGSDQFSSAMPQPRPGEWLLCDLDGTLIASDMLDESFWAACTRTPSAPMLAAWALATGGRSGLKARLSALAPCAPAALPYRPAVLHLLESWRAAGGRCALVTASDEGIARAIADHLGLFDEVHGSAPGRNLKGMEKAEFILQHFGAEVTYAGDSPADLAVWDRVARALTVAAPAALRSRAEALSTDVHHIEADAPEAPPHRLPPLLRVLRPHQWLKNLLVFLPMLAAHALTAGALVQSLLAFVAFSLVASSVYVLNDLMDLAADRAHPRKRHRPFASGALPLRTGLWLAPGLVLAGFALALLLGPLFLAVMAAYYALTTAYSFRLKRLAILDICTLAGLYAMRVVAGGAATGIPLSAWLLAFTLFFFFSLAAVKRQAELVDNAAAGREVATGRGYRTEDLMLVSIMAVASGYLSVLVMALYVESEAVQALYATPQVLWGACGVLLYWLSRCVLLTHRGEMHDDPVVFALRDRTSQVCLLLILGLFTAGSL
ncbi:UbiA family prenyltransferase [Oceanicola sp. S124]|uniref:UbiA family prenyltransferase n=1 Tax=Oceanicola sp. S124 TaxID=1042378 RepID=UPI0002557A9D|nr:UbiA family prenyltransferase [Oceanicola sp. S124]